MYETFERAECRLYLFLIFFLYISNSSKGVHMNVNCCARVQIQKELDQTVHRRVASPSGKMLRPHRCGHVMGTFATRMTL